MLRSILLFSTCLAVTAGAGVRSQSNPDDGAAARPEDPFTAGDPERMQRLGVVGYGPFAWADGIASTDVDKLLGDGRLLWLETEHFKIGSTLGTCAVPKDSTARRLVKGELKLLHDRLAKIPSSRSRLEPWLRLHLYALRAEQLYDEIAALTGKADADGHLGQPRKILLLLFDRKSDLARYSARFCGRQTEISQTHLHVQSGHSAVMMTAEGDDGVRDCETAYAQFRFLLTRALLQAVGETPPWLGYGLAHVYEREVPCNMINCGIRADESVDPATQYDWPRKVQKRVRHDGLVIPFRELCREFDLGYYGHVQAWSRVDYLMQDRERFAQFVQLVVGNPSRARQLQALATVYELDPEPFDEAWREWARKHY